MSNSEVKTVETIHFASPQELLATDYELPPLWRYIPCSLVIKESAFRGKFAASVQIARCEVSRFAPRTVLRLFPKGKFPKGVDVVEEIETAEFDGIRHVLCRIANPHQGVDVEDHRLAIITAPPSVVLSSLSEELAERDKAEKQGKPKIIANHTDAYDPAQRQRQDAAFGL